MGEMSFPPALQHWINLRVAEDGYADAADYLRDLVRMDRFREQGGEQDTAWLRAQIQEGIDSGFVEGDARAVLRDIMAEHPVSHGD